MVRDKPLSPAYLRECASAEHYKSNGIPGLPCRHPGCGYIHAVRARIYLPPSAPIPCAFWLPARAGANFGRRRLKPRRRQRYHSCFTGPPDSLFFFGWRSFRCRRFHRIETGSFPGPLVAFVFIFFRLIFTLSLCRIKNGILAVDRTDQPQR